MAEPKVCNVRRAHTIGSLPLPWPWLPFFLAFLSGPRQLSPFFFFSFSFFFLLLSLGFSFCGFSCFLLLLGGRLFEA